MASPCWSDLPDDILRLIFRRPTLLGPVDILRCRDVCLSWKAAVQNLYGQKFAQLLPSLLFFPRKTSGSSDDPLKPCTYSTEFYRLQLPMVHYGCLSIYSSRGWILSSTNNELSQATLFLCNPLSRKLIFLTVPELVKNFKFPLGFVLSSSPINPSCIMILFDNSKRRFVRGRTGSPVYSGAESKVPLEDIVYYKGYFLGVKHSGTLVYFKFGSEPCVRDISRTKSKSEIENIACSFRYLVESLYGDLLMVIRYVLWDRTDTDPCFFKTIKFEVFLFDWKLKVWRVLIDLGDQALFLVHNDSRAVSAIDSNGCKRNCIFFLDDAMEGHCRSNGRDYGVFDMETGIIEQFYSVPFNRWFKPEG